MNKISKARIGDAKEIKDLLSVMHKESRYAVFDLDDKKLIEFIRRMIGGETSLVLVCKEEVRLVGVFMGRVDEMYFSRCKVASDHIFYVAQDYRGQGLASAMIKTYVDWAKNKGADDIGISTSTGISRKAVEKIAEKYGLKRSGELYRIDHV